MTESNARNQNKLLGLLPDTEWRKWESSLQLIDLPAGMVLHEPTEPMLFVYFPTTAIITLHHKLQKHASAHFATVGNEGFVDTSSLFGNETALSRAAVQIAGMSYRLPANVLKDTFFRSVAVMQLLLRYTQALMAQISHSAVCNCHHSLDQRLCRWLLHSLDRNQGNDIVITQDLIAEYLGVRRSGVTIAAMKLQESGLVRYARGRIAVLDRLGLEHRSCECYQSVKNDYARLFPGIKTI